MADTPRPSRWVDVPDALAHVRSVRADPRRTRGVLVLTVVSAAALGCPEAPPASPDAAARTDATIVETGLAFDDARSEDASVFSSDALPARDAGLPLCRGACDPVERTGCASTEICAVRDEEASCGAPGRGARGSVCTLTSECAAGLACFATDDGGGMCDRVCCPGAEDCASPEVCGGDGALVDGTRSSWGRCLAPRAGTLLDPTACPAREACYVVGPLGESECLVAGTALEGEPCALPNDCAADLLCIGASDRTCARLCALGGSTDPCGSSAMCVRQAYTPDGVGVCVAAAARMR
jgi:hypothetical protein